MFAAHAVVQSGPEQQLLTILKAHSKKMTERQKDVAKAWHPHLTASQTISNCDTDSPSPSFTHLQQTKHC